MEKLETLDKISKLEARIKKLGKEREELRAQAVTNGWARWTFTVRMTAPNLQWWKENKPRTWEKYATMNKVKKFEPII